jgi:3-hydroxybutyryl-CoA dehydrogenase
MDMAELRMALDIGNLLKETFGDRFRFSEVLKQKLYAGHLGRKNSKGLRSYE